MKERVLHALDLGMLGDWDGAKRSLENLDDPIVPRLAALLTDQQRRERERAEVQAIARHELGNAISIAQANMEALVDGVLEPTPERLAGIRDAMITCGQLLQDLRKQSRPTRDSHVHIAVFDICELIASQVDLVHSIAESKNVAVHYEACGRRPGVYRDFRGDPDRVALIVRDVLLGAVRYTPPGGRIDMSCARPNGEIELAVSTGAAPNGETFGFSLASKLLEVIGGQASIVSEHDGSTTFVLHLPVIALASKLEA
jgi:signal transduction histidine kinase